MPGPSADYYATDYGDPAAWAEDDPIGALVSSDVLADEGVQTYAEDLFVTSEEGTLADYGEGANVGMLPPLITTVGDGPETSTDVIGETYDPDAGTLSSLASDRGRQRGYEDGIAGRPMGATAAPPSEPYLADAYAQGYAEGYALGKSELLSGKPAGGGGGGGTVPTVTPLPTKPAPVPGTSTGIGGWWSGLSPAAKAGAGVAAGALLVGGVYLAKRSKRRKAA